MHEFKNQGLNFVQRCSAEIYPNLIRLIIVALFHGIKYIIFHTFRADMKKKRFIVHLFLSENIFAKPSQEK